MFTLRKFSLLKAAFKLSIHFDIAGIDERHQADRRLAAVDSRRNTQHVDQRGCARHICTRHLSTTMQRIFILSINLPDAEKLLQRHRNRFSGSGAARACL